MKIFNYDGPLMTVLTQIFDLVVLNLITLVMCVPIVTAGASLTAMHYVLWHSVRQEGDSVWKMYWRSFRQNFRQATLIWLGVLAVIAVLLLGAHRIYVSGGSQCDEDPDCGARISASVLAPVPVSSYFAL